MNAGRVFIIAEAGVNHNGDAALARDLVHAARDAGADAVKFQTFEPDKLVTRRAETASYQKANTGDSDQSQFDMLAALTLSRDAFGGLKDEAQCAGIRFLSTPFDEQSLAFLLELQVDMIKIGSGDITHGSLLLEAARSGKPIILSTGMSDYGDIDAALSTIAHGRNGAAGYPKAGARARPQNVSLLHCVSQYPAPMNAMNLNVIPRMHADFGLPVGLSDHTLGLTAAFAAVALGASIIEKHFTLDKSLPGPDHKASLDPNELAQLITGIREIEIALGSDRKECTGPERDVREVARRSLVAARDVAEGEILSAENITAKRPASGMSPCSPWSMYGKPATRSYKKDDFIDEQI